MADVKYSNLDRRNGYYGDGYYGRRTTKTDEFNKNPWFFIGDKIGRAIFEPYFERKRAKSAQQAIKNTTENKKGEDNVAQKTDWDELNKYLDSYSNTGGSIGANENGVYGVPQITQRAPGVYIDTARGIYPQSSRQAPGVYIDTARGIYPRTPQQNGQKPVTATDNGLNTVTKSWNGLVNNSGYNPGGTTLYTNGARDLNTVMPQGNVMFQGRLPQQAAAPSVANFPTKPANGPAPYTDAQLRQIAGQKFTPEELSRMLTADERARLNALIAPPARTVSSAQGGYAAPASSPVDYSAQATYNPNEVRGLFEGAVSATGRPALTPEAAGSLDQIMTAAANGVIPEEEAGRVEAMRVANNFSRAAATPAGATDYSSRFITPGHDESLVWHPQIDISDLQQNDPDYYEYLNNR